MNVKSDGESRKHHYTTKLITIPYVPNGNSRDRVGARVESLGEVMWEPWRGDGSDGEVMGAMGK